MTFPAFPYQRIEQTSFEKSFETALEKLQKAKDISEAEKAIDEIHGLKNELATQNTVCQIRHTVDTRDEFYEKENNFYDELGPQVESLNSRYYKALRDSPFRASLEKKYGPQLFRLIDMALSTFSDEIIEDLQEENRLKSEYVKIKGRAKLELDGKEYNLSSIIALEESPNRGVRQAAANAKWRFFEQNAEEIEGIYHRLVNVRNGMAQKLGYADFVKMGYDRMSRSDYDRKMVAGYREEIRKHVVPLATELLKEQATRIGVKALKHFDLAFKFPDGNAKPQGSPEWIIEQAGKMYHELSPETDEFFEFMRQNELMDLVAKPGKAPGGYCTYIGGMRAPFIFSNFNGTSGDIDVLTHEAGHAFQVYQSRDFDIPEYQWPTMEACEIHSMSMEFIAWPWMGSFFGDDVEKYYRAHLSDALLFLPYGVAVDEYQHLVYENPHWTPVQRNEAWLGVQAKYLPGWDVSEDPFLSKGGFWQKQGHIFEMPFYYIDYTLAQICALQFWKRSRKDRSTAWSDYLRLCKAGGSKSFLDLVGLAGLKSPFSVGTVEEVVGEAKRWLGLEANL